MKKLALRLEELSVETFPTEETTDRLGTVNAHYDTDWTQCGSCPTCGNPPAPTGLREANGGVRENHTFFHCRTLGPQCCV